MFFLVQSIIVAFYILTSACLMIYGFHCYVMIYLFIRKQKGHRQAIEKKISSYFKGRVEDGYPFVTIQLPIYNEADVVERLLYSAETVDYPRNRFEVQVLDDSTDETRFILDRIVARVRGRGLKICICRRKTRENFKAGALARGLKICTGDFVAIFDSDFIIPPNFLKRTIPLIQDQPNIACVQARWGHMNREENWITQAQSIGIDGHFTAEQGARAYNKLCLNFNGTAGIWRKSAIEAAGGWQGDTLTEDLDLSYRAQLAGYIINYDFDLECSAELPNTVTALKSQQKRWAKGSIETSIKLIPKIMRSSQLSFLQKIEAFLHLTHYSVAVYMTILFALTLPMLLWTPMPQMGLLLTILWTFIMLSALAPCVMYTASGCVLNRGMISFLRFPSMLVVGTGLCINNAIAVVEALLGMKSEFVRTPKSGSTSLAGKTSRYKVKSQNLIGCLEIFSGLYCVLTLFVYLNSSKFLFGFFIAAYAVGLSTFGFLTLMGCVKAKFSWFGNYKVVKYLGKTF